MYNFIKNWMIQFILCNNFNKNKENWEIYTIDDVLHFNG